MRSMTQLDGWDQLYEGAKFLELDLTNKLK